MANKRLVELPTLAIPATGDVTYFVQNNQSFQVDLDRVGTTIINNYEVITKNLPSDLMTTGNAELLLNGLNNASLAKLSPDRIDIDFNNFASGYFDIDGGTFYDTYINTSTFDGGTF